MAANLVAYNANGDSFPTRASILNATTVYHNGAASELKYNVGTTEQDYKSGKWIEILQQQADFYRKNKYASFSEIMAMELTPPYVPTLQEQKNHAITVVNQLATDKLNELFPPHELISMGYSSKDETEQIAYFNAFEQARDSINDTLESAIDAINLAENSQEIEDTLVFNAQIAAL